jgi:hypothetical protein
VKTIILAVAGEVTHACKPNPYSYVMIKKVIIGARSALCTELRLGFYSDTPIAGKFFSRIQD